MNAPSDPVTPVAPDPATPRLRLFEEPPERVPGVRNRRPLIIIIAITSILAVIAIVLILNPPPAVTPPLSTPTAVVDSVARVAQAAHNDSVWTTAVVANAIKAHDDSLKLVAAAKPPATPQQLTQQPTTTTTPVATTPTAPATPTTVTPAPAAPTPAPQPGTAVAAPVPTFTGRPEGTWADKVDATLQKHEERIVSLEVGEVMDLVTRAERYSLQLCETVHDTTVARFMNAPQTQRKLWWDAAFK